MWIIVIKQLKSLAPASQSALTNVKVLKNDFMIHQDESATVNSQDDGKYASQVVAEIIFFICQESVDLLSNLSADAFPHQHFITLCKNKRVSSKLFFLSFIYFFIYFTKNTSTARLQALFPIGLLIFCSGNLQFRLLGSACDPGAMISPGRYTSAVKHKGWAHY